MDADVRLLVFTDLDGTLIDHETYQWSPAQEAINALGQLPAGIVLASSKTSVEIEKLRTDLALESWPAIVENGAGILPPHHSKPEDTAQYDALRSVLTRLPDDLRRHFVGFGDMTDQDVAKVTGLSLEGAGLAKSRAFSEPGIWQGTASQQVAFQAELKQHGVSAIEGGRFLTLSFGNNKADQMSALIKHYKPQYTVALGDAPNDMEMLKAADFGVIIANPHRAPIPRLEGEAQGRIIRTKDAGPLGWNTAILDLLKKLNFDKD